MMATYNVQPKWKKLHLGFTLIELMISMVIGLFLMAGAIQVFVSSKKTFAFNEELSWVQENARYGVEFLTRDARMAGYFGCNSQSLVNTLNPVSGSEAWKYKFDQGMGGYDGDASDFPTTEFPQPTNPTVVSGTLPKSDVFTVLRGATEGEQWYVSSHNTSSATIGFTETPQFASGRILMITDCNHAAVFQHTGGNPGKAVHNTGNSTTPGNCTKGLGWPLVCTTLGTSYKYSGDAYVMEVLAHAYYVKVAPNGVPSLYRQEVTGGTTETEEELAQGIENLQILYGEDLDDDGLANRYVQANKVTDWTNIVSMRMHLLTRSLTNTTTEAQTFRFVGTNYKPTDTYLRKEFISTVKIRNRGV